MADYGKYNELADRLRQSRSFTNREFGPGAWDVADVMEIVINFNKQKETEKLDNFIERVFFE